MSSSSRSTRPPPSKRHRPEQDDEQKSQKKKGKKTRAHPYGVQPMGNSYFQTDGQERFEKMNSGLGLFRLFDDSFLLDFLSSMVDYEVVVKLMLCSKALWTIGHEEEIWKKQTLRRFSGSFDFRVNWFRTFVYNLDRPWYQTHAMEAEHLPLTQVQTEGFYSDIVYQSWRCKSCDLDQWALVDNIDRRAGLTYKEFEKEYLIPNKPVILTDVMQDWKAFRDKSWTKELLLERFGESSFKVSTYEMTLRRYFLYCEQADEETPMYLFDNEFGEKFPSLLEDYSVPEVLKTDFFSLLETPKDDQLPDLHEKQNHQTSCEEGLRPSYRWILMGPKRSGSTFHKDPNYTSAWNGLISGTKKWIMFPPDVVPPGIHPSNKDQDVTAPLSVTEWFLTYYKACRELPKDRRPIECIHRPGELIFIPHMWWHSVLNLESTIAVTQNSVNPHNLYNVVNFLRRNKKHHILDKLKEKMQLVHPEIWSSFVEAKDLEREAARPTKSSWSSISSSSSSATPFKFSFSFPDPFDTEDSVEQDAS